MLSDKLSKALAEAKQKCDFCNVSEDFLVNLIHSALSFDNQSLQKEEVIKVLSGATVGISSDKVRAITNQRNAFLKVLAMAKEQIEMDETNLKDLHSILADGMKNVSGGLYRNVNISVRGSNHTPCSHEKVYDRMDKYFTYLKEASKEDILEYISYSHLQLAKIHPFLDCNGRLARLVLNYELLVNGFKPVIITYKERDTYFKVLETFKVEKDIKPFVKFLEELEIQSLNCE